MTNGLTTTAQQSALATPTPSVFPIHQTIPTRPHRNLFLVGMLGGVVGIVLGIFSSRVFIPLILELRYVFTPEQEHIQINGTMYSPLTFFLRLEDRKADVFPISRIIFNHQDSVRRLPLRGTIPGLMELTALNNPLEALPENIGDLNELKTLQVMNGRLKKLPDSIGNLTNLEDLTLSGNRLTSLPDSIGNLTKLKSLNLAYNNLDHLPFTIRGLTSLEVLDLTGNRFTSYPTFLPPNIEWLIIGGNRIPIKTLIESNAPVGYIFY